MDVKTFIQPFPYKETTKNPIPLKRGKLSTSTKTTVKVSQRITIVKYVVAGTLIFTIIGGSIFLYLNFGNSENAMAGGNRSKEGVEDNTNIGTIPTSEVAAAVDFSAYLSSEEMELLTNRDFIRDTTRKEYTSVKWNVNDSYNHLTLEVTNNTSTYSLEIFDQNGTSVLHFANIKEEKFTVDKLELVANHQYSYLVRNSIGELYAGNFKF